MKTKTKQETRYTAEFRDEASGELLFYLQQTGPGFNFSLDIYKGDPVRLYLVREVAGPAAKTATDALADRLSGKAA